MMNSLNLNSSGSSVASSSDQLSSSSSSAAANSWTQELRERNRATAEATKRKEAEVHVEVFDEDSQPSEQGRIIGATRLFKETMTNLTKLAIDSNSCVMTSTVREKAT